MVVPPGLATMSFNTAGCEPVSSTIFALPQHKVIAIRNDLVSSIILHLFLVAIKQQRLAEGIAKADIREPALFEGNHQGHVGEVGTETSFPIRHLR